MAFQIIRHAFRMVFGNFGQALRVSVLPLVFAGLLLWGTAKALSLGPVSFYFLLTNPGMVPLSVPIYALFALTVATLVTAWVAVSWHRFVLLEEYTTFLPTLRWGLIGRYIWASLKVSFFVFGASFLSGFLVGVGFAIFGPEGLFVRGLILGFIVGAVTNYLFYRLALALPAIALGNQMSIKDSYNDTSCVTKKIWAVVFIMIFLNLVANGAVELIASGSFALSIALSACVYWVGFMVSVSILTTFYGHLIEKRPLID